MVGRIATVIRLKTSFCFSVLLTYQTIISLHLLYAAYAFGDLSYLSYISLGFIGYFQIGGAKSRIVYLLESLFGGMDR